jgi:leucyl-tRNA synthetase
MSKFDSPHGIHKNEAKKILEPYNPKDIELKWQREWQVSELYRADERQDNVDLQEWPTWEPDFVVNLKIQVPIQINGETRTVIEVSSSANQPEIEIAAFDSPKVRQHTAGQKVVEVIYVRGKVMKSARITLNEPVWLSYCFGDSHWR